MTEYGLIYTSGSPLSYRAALGAMGATWAKIIPAWWPYPVEPLAPRTLVRSSWGDPSYDGGRRAYPIPERVLEEARPYAALPGVAFEIGNEPNVAAALSPRRYGEALSAAVAACRAEFGLSIPIVAGSLSMNHTHRAGATEWLTAMGPALRACDGIAIHAYTLEEVDAARRLVRQHVSASLPLWLTECNVNAALSPAARAAALRELTQGCAVATLYHWCEQPGDDPVHFNPHYTLTLADCAALRTEAERPVLGTSVPGFAMDVRAELARYRTDELRRGNWQIGQRPTTTAITLHWNGPPVLAARQRGEGVLAQLKADVEWQTRPDWPGAKGGADGLQYHAAIDLDGVVWRTRDEDARLWHCGDAEGNRESLSLHLLVGRGQPVSDAMWASAVRLVEEWRARYRVRRERVLGHQEWGPSECPGPDIMARLRDYRGADDWTAWGAAHPLPVEQRGYAIPRAWLAEQRAGRPLGAATGAEVSLAPGRAARAFAGGVVVWMGGDRTEVVR